MVLDDDIKRFKTVVNKAGLHALNKDGRMIDTNHDHWNKVIKLRKDMDKAYDELFRAANLGLHIVTQLSNKVETLQGKIDVTNEENRLLREKSEELEGKLDSPNPQIVLPEDELKKAIKDCLHTIVKDAVKQALESRKLVSTYADAIKKTQEGIINKAKDTLDTTLSTALKDNQKEIVESTKAKQDADHLERERRSRNIVISNVPESKSTETEVSID